MRSWIVSIVIVGFLGACTVSVTESPPGSTTSNPRTTAVATEDAGAAPQNTPSVSDETALTGRIIFADDLAGIQSYDFATDELTTLYQPPSRGFTRNLAVSPDGSLIVFSYAPPPPEEVFQFGFTDLYAMPVDGSSEPAALLAGDQTSELYFLPAWSPDGTYLYYSRILRNPDGEGSERQIERMAYPDGEIEVVVHGAFSPQLSDDGSKMVYVLPDPDANRDELMVSNPDGTDPVSIIENNFFSAIDAPVFTPDGEHVIFSAVLLGTEMRRDTRSTVVGFLDRLMGVGVVEAHSVPSDLWLVPATGGSATQITFLAAINLWPSYSPDGKKLAVLSSTRIYIMNPDGSDSKILLDTGASGTMDWIP